MAIEFSSSALARFRNVEFRNDDTIANLDGNGLKANGELGNFIGKIFRSGKTEARNNAVREELLRSLGQAFGLSALTKEEGGRVAFSPDFMQKLEKILGRDVLKTGDFKIDGNGLVKSGRPLTQRRIRAIVSKAMRAGGEFDIQGYESKIAKIRSELTPGSSADKYFKSVKTALDFYKNEIEHVIIKNPDYTPPPAEEPEFLFKGDREEYEREHAPYLMFDYGKQDYVPLKRATDLREHLNDTEMPGNPLKMFIHLENCFKSPLDTRIQNDRDFDMLKKYLANNIRNYVELSVNCYFASKEHGKMDKFDTFLHHHDFCLDGRTTELMQFVEENLPMMVDVAPSGDDGTTLLAEEPKTQPVTLKTAGHTQATRLDQCIYGEIQLARDANPKATGWKDLAEAVKKNLVGLERPIATLDPKGEIVPLEENGVPVFRKVTAEDVDRLGPACCNILAIF